MEALLVVALLVCPALRTRSMAAGQPFQLALESAADAQYAHENAPLACRLRLEEWDGSHWLRVYSHACTHEELLSAFRCDWPNTLDMRQ